MRIPKSININIVNTHDEIQLGVRPKKFQRNQGSAPIRKSKLYHSKPHVSKASEKPSGGSFSGIKQNCTVIAKYRNNMKGHIKNLEYIQKEGKGREGEEVELYGSENNQEEYKNKMIGKNWRLIISPQSNDIDLKTLTKSFIEKLENETGYRFTWIAANHYNTDNFHTHLLINGKDKNGKDVNFLPREKVSQLFRLYASDLCTGMIGYRNKSDIEKDYEKMTEKSYFTKLDQALENYLGNDFVLSRSFLSNARYDKLSKRLEYLKKLNLINYDKDAGTYIFKKEWKDELKTLGKYNTYYDGLQYLSCSKNEYSIHDVSKDGKVSGKIRKIYTMQKDSNNFAVVLETKDGKGKYVPLNFYPEGCYTGDVITIQKNENKKTYINNLSRKK